MRAPLLLIAVALALLGAKQVDPKLEAENQAAIQALVAAADPGDGPPLREAVYDSNVFRRMNRPDWIGVPPPSAYFPDRAYRRGQGGVAVLRCAVATDGNLDGCAVLAVAPKEFGFDDAALRMASDRYLRVAPPAGADAGQPVRIVVKFPRPGR